MRLACQSIPKGLREQLHTAIYGVFVSLGVVLALSGCAASPPKTGPEAVCSNVFELGKWLINNRDQGDPWAQSRLLKDVHATAGSGQLESMVNNAFDIPYDREDSIAQRQLATISFSQRWQSVCMKVHGEGFQPNKWPAKWKNSFILHTSTLPYY